MFHKIVKLKTLPDYMLYAEFDDGTTFVSDVIFLCGNILLPIARLEKKSFSPKYQKAHAKIINITTTCRKANKTADRQYNLRKQI